MTADDNARTAERSASGDDARWMGAALGLAARGLGRVAPNPAVGCVLVADGRVVGRGWTQPGGRPHAEAEALARAGAAARGATAYVTLEPCSHHGRTPPCADALIAAGVARVVTALQDPDPRVAGQGMARLQAANVATTEGVLAAEAAALNRGYFLTRTEGRPLVTLKLATSLDGRIATAAGESRWITGPEARAAGHRERAAHDSVAVGVGTALADDPALTVRLPGFERGEGASPCEGDDGPPRRVVFDSKGRLPVTAGLCDGAAPTLILTGQGAPDGPLGSAQRAMVALGPDGRIDPAAALAALAERGVTRLMVEGGGTLAAGLLGAGFVDRLVWFRAGCVIGGDGLAGIGALGLPSLAEVPAFALESRHVVGSDVMEVWGRA